MNSEFKVNFSSGVLGQDARHHKVVFGDGYKRGEFGVEVGTDDVGRRRAEIGNGLENLTGAAEIRGCVEVEVARWRALDCVVVDLLILSEMRHETLSVAVWVYKHLLLILIRLR